MWGNGCGLGHFSRSSFYDYFLSFQWEEPYLILHFQIHLGKIWPWNQTAEAEVWSTHIQSSWPFVSDLLEFIRKYCLFIASFKSVFFHWYWIPCYIQVSTLGFHEQCLRLKWIYVSITLWELLFPTFQSAMVGVATKLCWKYKVNQSLKAFMFVYDKRKEGFEFQHLWSWQPKGALAVGTNWCQMYSLISCLSMFPLQSNVESPWVFRDIKMCICLFFFYTFA